MISLLSLAGTGTISPATVGLVSLAIGGLGGAGGVSDGNTGSSGANGGTGGDATAGNVIFTNTRTADAISDLSLISNAFAGGGGTGGLGDVGGNGGDGGQGQGGLTRVDISGGGTVLASGANVTLSAFGFGGLGRAGATGTEVTGNGGDGGDGIGGTAILNLGNDNPNPILVALNASGTGAAGGNGFDGGNGGNGTGGLAALNVIDATVVLDDPTIIANGTGGNGGLSNVNAASTISGNGGNGGNATGGTARLEVTGDNGNVDLGFIDQQSNAVGGQGAAGADNFSGDAGSGGSGGNAAAGRSELIARTGGTINLTSGLFDFSSTGTGGAGGAGGYTYANAPGDGGDGGFGTGGTAVFLAQGGTITGQDANFTVAGIGGDAGAGGVYGYGSGGANGVTGTGGTGTGGTATIEIQEGSPGIITLDNVVATANGTSGTGGPAFAGFGGRIEITDSSTDPAGLLTLGSLTANAFDTDSGSIEFSNSTPFGGFYVTGDSGAMSVLGDLTVNVVGNIEYDFDGDAQMTVAGNAVLNSGQNILIDHTNNASMVNSIDVSGTFDANAAFEFNSSDGTLINAGDTANIRAGRDATVADIRGVGVVGISAGFDANVTNAAVTGTAVVFNFGSGPVVAGPTLTVDAGFDPTLSFGAYDPNFNANISGLVTSTGNITVRSGGTTNFLGGSSTISDNGLIVQTGDDIVIASGASVIAANNPATTPSAVDPFNSLNNLVLQAGGITNLSTALLTPISSIIAAGDIDANNFAVVMSANAIDGLGGSITASSIAADINDAPSNAVIAGVGQSNDNGLLSGQCVQGNACFGTIIADNQVLIGQASNNDIVSAFIESGTVTADIIRVTTRSDIIMGTNGIATELNATSEFLAESTEGDVNLFDAAVTSNSIQINADGSLLGSGSLTSPNSIGIDVGGSIAAAGITTGGELAVTAGDTPGFYSVPGSMVVGSLTVGSGNINYDAGGDFIFGSITVPGSDINLVAGGNIDIGNSNTANNINLDASNITLGSILGGGDADIAASGTVDFGDVDAGGSLNINAGGDVFGGFAGGGDVNIFAGAIDIGNVSGGGSINIDGDDVNIGGADAGSVSISGTSGVNISGVSGGSIDIQGGGVGVGSAIGGSINIIGDIVSVQDASGDDIFIDSFMGVTANTLTSTNSIDVFAGGGDVTGTGDWNAGTTITIDNVANIALNNLTSGDALDLNAQYHFSGQCYIE